MFKPRLFRIYFPDAESMLTYEDYNINQTNMVEGIIVMSSDYSDDHIECEYPIKWDCTAQFFKSIELFHAINDQVRIVA